MVDFFAQLVPVKVAGVLLHIVNNKRTRSSQQTNEHTGDITAATHQTE